MKKLIVSFVFFCFAFPAYASSHPFGLGVIIGSPTGISLNYNTSRHHAIDGALAWSLGGKKKIHIHADYLWKKPRALRVERANFDFFFGVGGRFISYDRDDKDEDQNLGVRAPAGLSYHFRDPRIEIFGEGAIILNLISSTSVDIDLGIGARYYF